MSKDVLAATIGGGRRMRMIGLVVAAVLATALVPWVSAETAQPHGWGHDDDRGEDKFLFFASDGLIAGVGREVRERGRGARLPRAVKHGARASDDGLLTEAPPNTGSGWFTLATGAWAGVHGSTNNTFHENGDPFTATPQGVTPSHPGRVSAFDPGVLQAETLAQSAERASKKVAHIEWAGGTVQIYLNLAGRDPAQPAPVRAVGVLRPARLHAGHARHARHVPGRWQGDRPRRRR